jgi:hypothetical protein
VNHFEILGVPVDATQEQIVAAYRVRARQLHPDTKPDATPAERARLTAAMAQLNEAWSVLRDPSSRAEYREVLERGAPDEEEILVRMPADDECVMCGSHPAVMVKFEHQRAWLFAANLWWTEARLCRDCGRALGRSSQNRTLWTGWWGLLAFFRNLGVVATNAVALVRVSRLSAPRQRRARCSCPSSRPAAAWSPRVAAVGCRLRGRGRAGAGRRGRVLRRDVQPPGDDTGAGLPVRAHSHHSRSHVAGRRLCLARHPRATGELFAAERRTDHRSGDRLSTGARARRAATSRTAPACGASTGDRASGLAGFNGAHSAAGVDHHLAQSEEVVHVVFEEVLPSPLLDGRERLPGVAPSETVTGLLDPVPDLAGSVGRRQLIADELEVASELVRAATRLERKLDVRVGGLEPPAHARTPLDKGLEHRIRKKKGVRSSVSRWARLWVER